MCWLKPVLSPQNNGDFSALQIPSRYLGLNSYSCALTSFQWSTYQNYYVYGGLTNSLHKQQTDEKKAYIKTRLIEKVPVGEPRGFQVIGWQGGKKNLLWQLRSFKLWRDASPPWASPGMFSSHVDVSEVNAKDIVVDIFWGALLFLFFFSHLTVWQSRNSFI